MQGQPSPSCADCKRQDDTGGEWFAYSVQFAAFLCFQCYQRRDVARRAV